MSNKRKLGEENSVLNEKVDKKVAIIEGAIDVARGKVVKSKVKHYKELSEVVRALPDEVVNSEQSSYMLE